MHDAVTAARAPGSGVDVLVCDTSGRLHTNVNLMDELSKVRACCTLYTRACCTVYTYIKGRGPFFRQGRHRRQPLDELSTVGLTA